MRVKTFRGERAEVMEQVKRELGPEAVIVSTKEFSGGAIEVAAGLEPEEVYESAPSEQSPIFMLEQVIDEQDLPCFPGQESLEAIFASQGLSAEFSQKLIDYVDPNLVQSGAPTDKIIGESLSRILHFDPVVPRGQRVIAMVGAPGVGKTTTIAKLAAQMHDVLHLKIGLIAADSFRVGAGFHLQTYASIMHMPFRLLDAQKPFAAELRRALDAFKGLDLVFVDTPGCGAREQERIAELASGLESFAEIERMIVLPAPSNHVDLLASARVLEPLRYQRIILSKLDESAFIGPAVSVAQHLGRSFAFYTTGQRVPEDIEPASARRMGWMLTRTIH